MIATLVSLVGLPWLAPLLGGGAVAGIVARFGLGRLLALAKAHRGWITLVAIAIVAAFLWARYADVRGQRDRAYAWRARTCAAVGIDPHSPSYKRGDCIARVMRLAAFERDTLTASNQALAAGLADANRKQGDDIRAAQAAAHDALAAAQTMEKANAKVGADDRVDGAWFGALNRVGGL